MQKYSTTWIFLDKYWTITSSLQGLSYLFTSDFLPRTGDAPDFGSIARVSKNNSSCSRVLNLSRGYELCTQEQLPFTPVKK